VRHIIAALGLVILVTTATPVRADIESAGDLLSMCNERTGSVPNVFCLAYIVGIVDYNDTLSLSTAFPKMDTFCISKGLTTRQLQLIVTKFLNERPKNELNYAASSQVMLALREAFPCTP
jgi:hypothetical protein